MTRFARKLRLVPIVLAASASLLALKTFGFWLGTGALGSSQRALAQVADDAARLRAQPQPSLAPQRSWAQEVLGYPEITGSIGGSKPVQPSSEATKQPADQAGKAASTKPKTNVEAAFVPDGDRAALSAGERAVLERLQDRRQELEARARELEIREGLLKAAEKRIEARIGELKELEGQINGAVQKKDEAEAARFKSLVTMYENMKAKEAARIFDRLELRILIDVALQINPRRMSDILAQMSPEAAERLTVELASRSHQNGKPASTADLPKIEGKPRI